MASGRRYEQSHPWIAFTLDLRPAAPRVWSLLGQAVARCRQIAEAALPPLEAAEMYRLYLSRGARATTAIEGNTLSEAQVRARLEGQLELPLSQEYLGREVDNILESCDAIWQEIIGGRSPRLSPELLADYNRRVLAGLEEHLDEGVIAGEIPHHRVAVGGYQGAPRGDCAYLLDRLCAWLEQDQAPEAVTFFAPADHRIAISLLHAETFDAEPPTLADARRRTLVLALGAEQRAVPKSRITELTPALARSYATRTEKTLTRDLNWLRERELVLRTAQGYRTQMERMLSFQPDTAQPL